MLKGLPILQEGLTFVAGISMPARDADLVPVLITRVVSELIIPRSAQLGARLVEVVLIALHAHPVREAGRAPGVGQGVPLGAGVDDTRVCVLLYDPVSHCRGQPRSDKVTEDKKGW